MRAFRIYFSKDEKEEYYVSCEVEVPGLGVLKIKDVLSVETMEAAFREVESAARVKLNILEHKVSAV